MFKWLEDKIMARIQKKLDEMEGVQKHLDQKMAGCLAEVNSFRAWINKLDTGLIGMTKEDVENLVKNKLVIFEGDVDDKLIGTFRSIDEKISNGNGHARGTASLMKKMARLEDVKDKVENRKSTKEIMEFLEEHKEKALKEDKSEKDITSRSLIIQTLQWVLGETNE
jgi:phage shock protein A